MRPDNNFDYCKYDLLTDKVKLFTGEWSFSTHYDQKKSHENRNKLMLKKLNN